MATEVMPSHQLVTSMSKKGYEEYGKYFLASYAQYLDWPLTVFHDGWKPPQDIDGVTYLDLDLQDRDAANFREDHRDHPTNYRKQPVKFSRKVFAMTNLLSAGGWVIWVDADVIVWRRPNDSEISQICPEDKAISYLGRPWFKHTETGFIAFDTRRPEVARMMFDMRCCYTKWPPTVLSLEEQHDSMVFDLCLKRSEIPKDQRNDLCKNLHGLIDVWPKTVLRGFSSHYKGPIRKKLMPTSSFGSGPAPA